MLRKERPTKIMWDAKSTGTFPDLKRALSSAPVLITPDFTKPFIVQTDASQTAIRGVLSQDAQDGDHPVAYLSNILVPREQNYSTTEQELLAIVWAIGSPAYYLRMTERKYNIYTCHISCWSKIQPDQKRYVTFGHSI